MKYILLSIFFLFSTACEKNLLSGFGSSQSEDEVKYEAAKQALNNNQYDAAIDIIMNQMSASMQAQGKVKEILASSYGGKCGWNLLDYAHDLSAQTTGSAFHIMMSPFVGKSVTIADCISSLEAIESIGPTSARTLNQNIFASIAGMVLLGSSIRTYADTSPALGNGSIDVNICDDMPDSELDDIILGFGFFGRNFAAVSSSLVGNYGDDTMIDIIAICDDYGVVCAPTNKNQIDSNTRLFFRSVLNTQEFGVGNFSTGGDASMIPMSCL